MHVINYNKYNRSSAKDIVLNYHETLLRCSDVDLLKGPYWLNDTVLSFYFEYLEHDRFKNSSLLFVPPEVTQCIKIAPIDEIKVFLDPLQGNRKDFIFFALNDNTQTEYSGGTHWSLLVFSDPDRQCYHFDSSSGSNRSQAIELSDKLMKFFRITGTHRFCEMDCIQQTNSYDCGIFVLCHAEHVASYAVKNKKISGVPLLDPSHVRVKRDYIVDLIYNLA